MKLLVGIWETRENRKIAASKDWKKIRAPAKKKLPMLIYTKGMYILFSQKIGTT
jgi:hypothetical protein